MRVVTGYGGWLGGAGSARVFHAFAATALAATTLATNALAVVPVLAAAGPAPAAALPSPELPPVLVVAPAPLPGADVPRELVAVGVQGATSADLQRSRPRHLAELLDEAFAGVNLSEAQGNPFQTDLSFRGFSVSPLLGSQNALAVLVDGVRVNESFGDVVLWDLIPTFAVERVDLVPGGGPVFGPNALGGTLAIRTLSGRDAPGVGAALGTGAFGRETAELTLGGARGDFDAFVGASSYEDDGWRDRSPSRVRQLHAKLGWEREATRIALAYTRGDNRMNGNGLVPEALLGERREAVYTYPDVTQPRLDFWQVVARHEASANSTLTAHAYWRRLRIGTLNGDAEFDDGDTPLDTSDDEHEAEFRSTRTRQETAGAALQFAWRGELAGLAHRLALGVTHDAGRARFGQFEQDGAFTADRGVEPDGTPELDTDVLARTRYTGTYLSDLISLGATTTLTLAARHDAARVSLEDRSGLEPDLNGRHRFSRLNPSFGLTWSRTPALAVTLAYSEGFRVPTPVELTCASPDDPCALPVAFVADPPLDPVVARSWEAGARGAIGADAVRWRATAYRTRLTNDILFTAVGAGRGFFANFPSTRRQGLEFELRGGSERVGWHASWSLVDATYRSALALFNPVANDADPAQPAAIDVRRGDRLPATPRQLAKLGVHVRPWQALELGAGVRYAASQFLRGDDANGAAPLDAYTVVDLRFRYELSRRVALRGGVDNVFDERYASIGAFNRVAFEDANEPLEGVGPGPVQRFVSPGAPRSWWLSIEYRTGGAR